MREKQAGGANDAKDKASPANAPADVVADAATNQSVTESTEQTGTAPDAVIADAAVADVEGGVEVDVADGSASSVEVAADAVPASPAGDPASGSDEPKPRTSRRGRGGRGRAEGNRQLPKRLPILPLITCIVFSFTGAMCVMLRSRMG